MKIKATINNLILKPVDNDERVTESGIVIGANSAESQRSIVGEVVAVGSAKVAGDKLVDMESKVGDKVLFDVYRASEFKYNGQLYYSISESEGASGKGGIVGILE